jgi:hypothetical protein
MTLCQLIKAIDDFNGKFGISGVGDVFFLYGGVNQYGKTSLMSMLFCSLSAILITNTSVATQTICQVCLVTPPSWCTLGSV